MVDVLDVSDLDLVDELGLSWEGFNVGNFCVCVPCGLVALKPFGFHEVIRVYRVPKPGPSPKWELDEKWKASNIYARFPPGIRPVNLVWDQGISCAMQFTQCPTRPLLLMWEPMFNRVVAWGPSCNVPIATVVKDLNEDAGTFMTMATHGPDLVALRARARTGMHILLLDHRVTSEGVDEWAPRTIIRGPMVLWPAWSPLFLKFTACGTRLYLVCNGSVYEVEVGSRAGVSGATSPTMDPQDAPLPTLWACTDGAPVGLEVLEDDPTTWLAVMPNTYTLTFGPYLDVLCKENRMRSPMQRQRMQPMGRSYGDMCGLHLVPGLGYLTIFSGACLMVLQTPTQACRWAQDTVLGPGSVRLAWLCACARSRPARVSAWVGHAPPTKHRRQLGDW